MRNFRPKEGENWGDVYNRAKEFLNDLIKYFIKDDYVEEKNLTEKNQKDLDEKLLRQLENVKIENKKTFELKISDDEINELNISSKNELIKRNTQEIKISSKISQNFDSGFFDDNEVNKKDDNINILLKTKSKPYLGFDHSKETNRVLVVTHGGFIMELINVIRNKKGLEMDAKNNSFNTAVYVIKIYCSSCGGICNKCGQNKLEYDFIIFNDNSHCVDLK